VYYFSQIRFKEEKPN